MPTHRAERRTVSRWVRDDLRGTNSRQEIIGVLRRRPGIVLRGLVRAVLGLGVIALVLAGCGFLEQLGNWTWLAFIDAGLAIGRDVARHRETAPPAS